MKKILILLIASLAVNAQLKAQLEPNAGKWRTWFISSGKDYRLAAPTSYKTEIAEVLSAQQNLDAAGQQQILYWNAGAPGYRWHDMMGKLWTIDTGRYGALANMLLGTSIYDATIAAWDTKYAFNRPRPFNADKKIKALVPKMESPGYPCEHSVAAGVAVTIFSKFYPHLADSVNRMAQRAMASRIAAGVVFPSDTKVGFELGKKIALEAIDRTKDYITKEQWDGKMPVGPQYWRGKYAMHPMAGKNKTVVLESSSQFRPPAPPDFAKDMAELKSFKQTFRSQANAFYYASQNSSDNVLNQKMFEYNLHLNPPRAARIYAAISVAYYDGFTACWDAKYAYWGLRPDQYDTTYKSLLPTPPFPGYPSGHAMMGGLVADVLSYFFPADRPQFLKNAKDGAESRFQGGIHFRSDNEVGLELGRKIAGAVVQRISTDGADGTNAVAKKKE
jgi:membrane-associated phospholipid phosphatase